MCTATDHPTRPGVRCACPNPRERSARDRANHAAKTAAPPAPGTPLDAVPPTFDHQGIDHHDIEALQSLALGIAEAYESDVAGAVVLSNRGYASRLEAVRTLGAAVAALAEEHAGITADEVVESWQTRLQTALEDPDQSMQAARTGLIAGEDPETLADVRCLANGYRAALADIRDMGGDLEAHMPEDYDHEMYQAVRDAAQDYPADWLDASNRHVGELHVGSADRGSYNDMAAYTPYETRPLPAAVHRLRDTTPEIEFLHDPPRLIATRAPDLDDPTGQAWLVTNHEFVPGYRLPYGEGWERHEDTANSGWIRSARQQAGEGPTRLVGALRISPHLKTTGSSSSRYAAVATHELAHRMECAVAGLGQMEADWLVSRTTRPDGSREPLVHLGGAYGPHEVGYQGAFIHAYIGRAYDQQATPGAHEIVSVGWENVLHGRMGSLIGASSQYEADHDMKHFVLGAIASAGARHP